MLDAKKWKRIPDRIQNTYSLILSKSKSKLPSLSPSLLRRSKLPPISKTIAEDNTSKTVQSSLNNYEIPNPSETETWEQEITREELKNLIQTSLKKYPKLENSIRKLENEKIACKCSVFSKDLTSLDRIHGFSTIPCASDYCINRILEEPEALDTFTKSPKFYSLSPEKRTKLNVNKELVLYEKNLDSISRAVKYFHKQKNSEQIYENLYSEYVKSPNIFNFPRHSNRSPNFSVPKPKIPKKTIRIM